MVFLQEQKDIKIITNSDIQSIWNDTDRIAGILSAHKLKYTILDSSDSDDEDEIQEIHEGNDESLPYIVSCLNGKSEIIPWSIMMEYEKIGSVNQKFRYSVKK